MSQFTGTDMNVHYTTHRGEYRSLFARTRSLRTSIGYAAALGLAAVVGGTMATQAMAQDSSAARKAVEIKSVVMLERVEKDANGADTIDLVDPAAPNVVVVPGDRLLVTLTYTNTAAEPAANFVAVNPINKAIRVTSISEDWAEVSVDGGKTWGKLETLTVMDTVPEPGASASDTVADEVSGDVAAPETLPTTPRAAQMADITHVRWTFAEPIPPGRSGEVSFRGVVK